MALEYRVYLMDPDGHISQRVDLICNNDNDAKERAQQLADICPVELWRGDKFLSRFEHLN